MAQFTKILPSTLLIAGLLLVLTPMAVSQNTQKQKLAKQNPAKQELKAGKRLERIQNRQEAKQLRTQLRVNRERLTADRNQFGKGSAQVKSDRRQLRQNRAALRKLLKHRGKAGKIVKRKQ